MLKNIAIIAMFIDHLAIILIPHDTIWGLLSRVPGRIVAPIMCYFIAEGFFHTKNLKKYLSRLLLFSVISHIPYVLFMGTSWWKTTSVFWGLTLGLVALTTIKTNKINPCIKIIVITLCCVLAYPADWNFISVLWIVCFGWFRGKFAEQMTSMLCIGYFFTVLPFLLDWDWPNLSQLGISLAIPLLHTYNGTRGNQTKLSQWFFYLFYPTHLLIIYGLKFLLSNHA